MPIDRETQELFDIHNGPVAQFGRAQRAGYFDDTRSWVDPNGYKLSDRLWFAREDLRRNLDAMIVESLRTGEDAIKTSKRIERFLNPRYAPIRDARGRIIRDKRKGVYTGTPRDGMGSFPARRLMRTEVTRAHGKATIEAAKKLGNAIRWSLSGSHPKADKCDENAQGSSRGINVPGVYRIADVPAYPNHPQDLCHLQHWALKSDDDLVAELRVKYGLAPPEEVQAYSKATDLVNTAKRADPRVTGDLQDIGAAIDGHLEGLQYRVKSVSSTTRKIQADMAEKRIGAQAAGDGLRDVLRYTYTLPETTYGAGVRAATETLIDAGYRLDRMKNFWANDSGYTAAQAVFRSPTGQYFELQFHTERSLYVKEQISHPLYEQARVLDKVKDADEIERLNNEIAAAWESVRATPPNLEGVADAVGMVGA